jgi:hypothetical protein
LALAIRPRKKHALAETLDGGRWVYNYFLSLPPMSEYDMNYALTELKEQHPWLRGKGGVCRYSREG